jgi:hypothetical protein
MPLRDHFHPPLSQRRDWEDFHAVWSVEIRNDLNLRLLPQKYYAATQIHVGGRVEVDLATLEETGGTEAVGANGGVAIQTWAPPVTTLAMATTFPDEFEVQVLATTAGSTLVAAIEFVSPGNKDRPEKRRAFVAKCASYLQLGVGLLIVDVVTERHANLHDDLVTFLEQPPEFHFATPTALYTTAYRPARRPAGDQIDLWLQPLAVGERLPVMPLALRGGPVLPIDLEATYSEMMRKSRVE